MGKKKNRLERPTEKMMTEFFKEQGIEEERFTKFFSSEVAKKVFEESYTEVAKKISKDFFEQKSKDRFREMIYMKLFCLVDLAKKGTMPPEWAEDTCSKILKQNPKTFSQDLTDACEYVKESLGLKS